MDVPLFVKTAGWKGQLSALHEIHGTGPRAGRARKGYLTSECFHQLIVLEEDTTRRDQLRTASNLQELFVLPVTELFLWLQSLQMLVDLLELSHREHEKHLEVLMLRMLLAMASQDTETKTYQLEAGTAVHLPCAMSVSPLNLKPWKMIASLVTKVRCV